MKHQSIVAMKEELVKGDQHTDREGYKIWMLLQIPALSPNMKRVKIRAKIKNHSRRLRVWVEIEGSCNNIFLFLGVSSGSEYKEGGNSFNSPKRSFLSFSLISISRRSERRVSNVELTCFIDVSCREIGFSSVQSSTLLSGEGVSVSHSPISSDFSFSAKSNSLGEGVTSWVSRGWSGLLDAWLVISTPHLGQRPSQLSPL